MAVTLEQFVERLIDSRLLPAEDVAAERDRLSSQQALSAQTLARELVRSGKLTAYQASRVYEGRGAGLILGNNVILEKIGEGGMGEVFKAEHRRMKRPVVVKVLPAAATHSKTSLKRFQREVEAAAKLSHPNIVTAFDADVADGVHFLVMEYVDGIDLGDLLARHGPFPVGKAAACIVQAARGLNYAHQQGVIHRDIKPNNLLLDRSGAIKVLDMGLARFDGAATSESGEFAESLTQENQIVGTVDYMSPEQADDSAHVDARSDIYSLGCTMFRLLTGSAPYQGSSAIKKLLAHRTAPIPSLRESRQDIPEPLESVFRKMVAKAPGDRYQSMDEVIRELAPFQSEEEFDVSAEIAVAPAAGDSTGLTQTVQMDSAQSHRQSSNSAAAERTSAQAGEDTDSDQQSRPRKSPPAQPDGPPIPAVGIDLGTTYSAIAHLDDLGRPQTLINAEGDKITPSVVLFEDDDVIVGKEAVKAMATDMALVAECAKRDLGFSAFHKQIGGRQFPPETIEAWVLNKLRCDAQRQIGEIPKAVITVPAYFDEVRRKATQDAGYIAGLDVLDIINEPTAAAVSFGFSQGFFNADSSEKKNILVYDLGGGTFDVTIMEIGGAEFKALATDGDVKLGGRDWDQRLVDAVAEAFLRKNGLDPRDDPNTLGRLWRECEDAKRTLSARSKSHITCDFQGQAIRIEVTRKKFEEITRDLLDRTEFTTRQTLKAAGLEWDDIDRVLLVGGSTRMPAVVDMLRKLSGQEPDTSVSPDEAVAHGAALHAGLLLAKLQGKPPRFLIKNVNSHSLGVVATDMRTKRPRNAILIPRNTSLPVTAKRVFKTQRDGQKSILVQIIEGESASPDDCSQLGKCVLRDLPPDLPAKSPIEVYFRYEENGRLRIMVQAPGTNKKVKHEIARENTMTRDDLNAWRQHISGLPPAQRSAAPSGQSAIGK